MQNRTASGGVYREDVHEAQSPFGVSIAYLGLLFAVLASGCQSSDLGSKERELTSQVYGMLDRYSFVLPLTDASYSVLLLPMSSHDQFLVSADH